MSENSLSLDVWHYRCPKCGMSDRELGYHATADLIWCEVCLEEKRYVRLHRWPIETSGPPPDGG